jgi:hypothetical protein
MRRSRILWPTSIRVFFEKTKISITVSFYLESDDRYLAERGTLLKKTVILVLMWLGVPSSPVGEFVGEKVVERCWDAQGHFMLCGGGVRQVFSRRKFTKFTNINISTSEETRKGKINP